MTPASPEERRYFERIARANGELDDNTVPDSLAEMFDRLEDADRRLGLLGKPGVAGDDEGDLQSHLAFLEKVRRVRSRGTRRP